MRRTLLFWTDPANFIAILKTDEKIFLLLHPNLKKTVLDKIH